MNILERCSCNNVPRRLKDWNIAFMSKGWSLAQFPHGEKEARRDSISVFKYLKGGCNEDGVSVFSVFFSARSRGNGHKLIYKRLHLNTRRHFCTVQVPGCQCMALA